MSTSAKARRMAAPLGGALALLLAGIALPAAAQDAPAPAPAAMPDAPTDNAMVNLVRLLVEQGVITADKGSALVAQARGEADRARAAAPAQLASGELPPAPAGTIRVPYVPATVRAQIKEELKAEVLQTARTEGWAAPGEAVPEWVRRLRLYGDVRFRTQSTLFSATNSNLIPNFAALNRGAAVDVINQPIPFLNTTADRINELRLRARIGAEANLGPHLTAGVMLGVGDDPSPVSSNVSLGGGLAKRQIWLQKAYIDIAPTEWAGATFGRFDNPFLLSAIYAFPTSSVLFDPDLQLDGVAARISTGSLLGDALTLTARGGAFPLDFGNPDRVATSTEKEQFPQKYLFSGQLEAAVQIEDLATIRLAGAYHHFQNLQGRLSEPCLLYAGAIECSTDDSRPFFLTKGNTLSPLRQIAVDPNLPAGAIQPQPQYFGLTFDYHILDVTAQGTVKLSEKIKATLSGNYAKNLGFDRGAICRNGVLGQPFNNGGADGNGNICGATNATSFIGGDEAYQGYLSVGYDRPSKWGEWSIVGGYRYIESDAVLDALADNNFHAGGTNAKGYFLGGSIGLYDNLALTGRWMSANEVSGEPLSIDVFQIDLTAAF